MVPYPLVSGVSLSASSIDLRRRGALRRYLTASGGLQRELLREADRVRRAALGDRVFFRGIVEFSNVCEKNCYYCGIRRGNRAVRRYHMTMEEIAGCLEFIRRFRYGSVVFQAGERTSGDEREFLVELVRFTRARYPDMGITLSLGELPEETYRALKEAGADRYLLRIETSVPRLYRRLHPRDHSLRRRKQCLRTLRSLGYQVGCGNMVGLPGQTTDDLIADLRYFVEEDFDMFGLGPYVIHAATPLATPAVRAWWRREKERIFQRTLNVIALLRILMPTCNIAAATALDVFRRDGREQALMAGANVLMPSVTPRRYRRDYLLYENKPCLDGDAERCGACIVRKAARAHLRPALGVQGNPIHYLARIHGKA